MRHYHGHRILTSLASTVLAALLGVGGMELQSDAQSAGQQSDLNSILGLYRDGAGGLGIPAMFVTGTPPDRSVGIGDENHDGHADLAMWHAGSDTLWILPGDGVGGFGSPRIASAGSRQKVVAVGDFDKDGIADEAVAEQFSLGARLRFGDGTGRFRPSRTAVTSRPGAVLVADFNRDGRIDLARLDGSHLAVLLGTVDGGFGAETLVPVGMVASVMATGDFNGDGTVDLALADRGAEKVAVLLGDVRGSFTLMGEYPAGLQTASLAAGDLTGDGVADLVAADRGGEHVVILSGDGTGGFGAPTAVGAASSLSADGKTPGNASAIEPGAASTSSGDVYEGVRSLTLNPATVAGGTGASSTGTVTLNAPAPANGVVVALASSNVELAATLPSITVPAGATQATFTVTTNSMYRRWSGLGFSVTISATHAATVSATLNVTAQARPAAFNSGVAAGDQTQWAGLMCSNIPPIGFEGGILVECTLPPAIQGQWGSCTFRQECSLGCRRTPPPNGVNFNDFCATTGPNPIAVSSNYIVSGDRVPASLILEAPAPGGGTTSGFVTANTVNGNASAFPNATQPADPFFPFPNLAFPTGASTAVFDVATSYVPSINFVLVNGEWHPPGGGGNFFIIDEGRSGHGWIAAVPPNPPPASPIPTLGQFLIVGANPVTGGQSSLAQFHLSGLTPGDGPTITVTSSHPAIVPSMTVVAPTSVNLFGFDASIDTEAPTADTDVTLTASDGRYTFSKTLRVLVPDPPPVLAGVSVNPTSVVGGNSATGTVRLSTPQSGPTVVQVAILETAPATLPTNDPPCPPSSRCHNVTVPAGATSASFNIGTSAVTSQYNLNVNAHLPGSPGQSALLLITPGGPPRLWSLSHSPDTVIGGEPATGTATLRAPAPSGGVVIPLADDSSAASIPASVTVPAGQISATFPITTSAVTSTTTVTISTTFAGETFNDFLLLFTALRAVEFNPSTVVGGTPSTGSVILGTPAPAGGAVVTLSSSNTALVRVPANVTVPAGATSATFTATTSTVTAFSFADISASYAGATVSSRLFLSNASETVASLAVNPTSVVGPGSVSATVTLGGAVSCCVVVELTSSDPALAQVPFSLSFSQGQSSATFTVNLGSVSATKTATISASLNGTTRSATVTVNPSSGAKLSAVSLNPASVGGGNPSTGTVTLTAPAPAGGAAVTLASNKAAATVPTSVTVAAGTTAASFSVATASVTAATTATISATYGGVLGTATLTITPSGTPPTVTVSALSLNPGSVVGGNASTGTVTLSGAAPSGGAAVTLSSNNAAATVSASVTVAAGATTASFTVGTAVVSASTTATISANYGGALRTATLTVAPAGPAPVTLSALSLSPASVAGGNASTGTVTLSGAAPSGGAAVTLSSNNTAATVPASVTVAAGATVANFTVNTTAVSANTTVVIAGTLGVTRSASLTVTPPPVPAAPTLVSPANRATVAQPVTLNWNDVANATSYEVQVDNSSTISAPFVANPTVTLSQATLSGLPAQQLWWRVRARNAAGVSGPFSSTRRFTPQAAAGAASLSSVTANPSSVVGPASATGTVTLTAGAPTGGALVTLTSSNPGVASVPGSVTVAAGATTATFNVTTTTVAANTGVTITGTYSGVTRTATLTITPAPPPASLSAVALNPASVTGGASSTGTVTLTSAAPAGGITVTLSSNTGAATVPATVTVAAGATTATFTVTTATVSTATVSTITAAYNGVTRSATVTVNPPAASATLTVTATGRSGERVTSSPAGINVPVGSTGSASFAANTSITLSVTNGRDAIWSGACSSGGDKTRTCTFTITGSATVAANVQ
jgi:trimeric autotransporter adhesin